MDRTPMDNYVVKNYDAILKWPHDQFKRQAGHFCAMGYFNDLPADRLTSLIRAHYDLQRDFSDAELAAFARRYFSPYAPIPLTPEERKMIAVKPPETTHDLARKLEEAARFFAPENLAALTLKYEGAVALLVIDVQKQFCDPEAFGGDSQTAAIARRIQSIAPEFRKAGIPVYATYYSKHAPQPVAEEDFYEFTPAPPDIVVTKNANSAFGGTGMGEILKRNGKKLLLVCGFNFSACVRETVMDARKEGFEVCLLGDLTGNDTPNGKVDHTEYFTDGPTVKRDATYYMESAFARMREEGVAIVKSDTLLRHLRANTYSRSS